jgi:hypothetical protein
MGELKKDDTNHSAPILDEEDEATLAAIDRGIQSADEGRVPPGRSPPANAPVAYKILFTEDALSDLEGGLKRHIQPPINADTQR